MNRKGYIGLAVLIILVVGVLAVFLQPVQAGNVMSPKNQIKAWDLFLETYRLQEENCSVVDYEMEGSGRGDISAFTLVVRTQVQDAETAYSLTYPGVDGTMEVRSLDISQVRREEAEVPAGVFLQVLKRIMDKGFLPGEISAASKIRISLSGRIRLPEDQIWDESDYFGDVTQLDGQCFRFSKGMFVEVDNADEPLGITAVPLCVQVVNETTGLPAPGAIVIADMNMEE